MNCLLNTEKKNPFIIIYLFIITYYLLFYSFLYLQCFQPNVRNTWRVPNLEDKHKWLGAQSEAKCVRWFSLKFKICSFAL